MPRKNRGRPLHWSWAYVPSIAIHTALVVAGALYIWEHRPRLDLGEKGRAIIEVAYEPDRQTPEEPEDVEPTPDVIEPEVLEEPELEETPEEEPTFEPEDTPPPPPDWEPPRDLFANARPLKQKPKPEPKVEPEPERTPPQPVAQPEPPKPQQPTVLQGANLPAVLKKQTPAYPRKAVRLRWQGTVVLRIQVNAAGKVIDVVVHESSGHDALDQAAIAAFRNWVFEPRGPDDPEVRLLQKPFTFRLG